MRIYFMYTNTHVYKLKYTHTSGGARKRLKPSYATHNTCFALLKRSSLGRAQERPQQQHQSLKARQQQQHEKHRINALERRYVANLIVCFSFLWRELLFF